MIISLVLIWIGVLKKNLSAEKNFVSTKNLIDSEKANIATIYRFYRWDLNKWDFQIIKINLYIKQKIILS